VWGRAADQIEGRVIAQKPIGRGGSRQQYKYLIEYAIPGGAAQRVELKRVMGWGTFPKMIAPDDGDKVPLLVDRRSGKVRFDVKNPAINRRARVKAAKARVNADYDKALNG
jgi:hypothetical protein